MISRALSVDLTGVMRKDPRKELPTSLAPKLYWQPIVTRKVSLPKIIFENNPCEVWIMVLGLTRNSKEKKHQFTVVLKNSYSNNILKNYFERVLGGIQF